MKAARDLRELVNSLDESLAESSVDLGSRGVSGYHWWAWSRQDSLKVVDLLRAAGYVILGGDVWHQVDARVAPAHLGWSIAGPLPSSPTSDDVVSAAKLASDYIEELKFSGPTVPLFEFVLWKGGWYTAQKSHSKSE